MQKLRLFFSSPSDVAQERDYARKVVAQLQKAYGGKLVLEAIFWEDLPLQADMTFQQGIELVLSKDQGADIAVFMLWSRLGTPLGHTITKPNGSTYQSGTEREFDLMMAAREASGGERPKVLVYVREDDAAFKERLRDAATDTDIRNLLEQKDLVKKFVQEVFHDTSSGVNQRAYLTYDRPPTFSQKLREHLTRILDNIVSAVVDSRPQWDDSILGPPYRGLQTYDFSDSAIFFGREDEILEINQLLRTQASDGRAFVLLTGASGSGKSSLARAGVLPYIVEQEVDNLVSSWIPIICTPSQLGTEPARSLSALITNHEQVQEGLSKHGSRELFLEVLSTNPTAAIKLSLGPALAEKMGNRGLSRIILLVDQLEELFTDNRIKAEDRAAFAELIYALATSGHCWVVATLRSDFFGYFQELAPLMKLKQGGGQYDVLPPEPAALRRVIEGPARIARLQFESLTDETTLADHILDEATSRAELLPLLADLLRELYERREDRVLTVQAYGIVGGVEGALARRAEFVFGKLPSVVQASLPSVLRQLVSVGGSPGSQNLAASGAVRRPVEIEIFPAGSPSRQLVDAFVAGRLFVVEGSGAAESKLTSESTVTIAHEALLRVWPQAALWVESNREFLQIRQRVATRRLEGSLLMDGDPLTESARFYLQNTPDGFPDPDRLFLEKSFCKIQEEKKKRSRLRRRTFFGMMVLTAFSTVFAITTFYQLRNASEARSRATANLALALNTVDKVLVEINNTELASLPGVQPLRLKLLQQAVDQYQSMALNSSDEMLIGLWVRAESHLATMLSEAGKMKDAIGLLNSAKDRAKRAIRDRPSSLYLKTQLLEALTSMATIYWYHKEPSNGLPAAKEAVQLADDLLSQVDSSKADVAQQIRLQAAKAYNTLGNLQRESTDESEVNNRSLYEKSLALYEKLLELGFSQTICQRGISSAKNNISLTYTSRTEFSKKLIAVEQSAEIAKKLYEDNPLSPRDCHGYAISLQNLGDAYFESGDTTRGLNLVTSAVDVTRKLVENNPQVPEYKNYLASVLSILGTKQQKQGNVASANQLFKESIDLSRSLIRSHGNSPQFAEALASALIDNAFFQVGFAQAIQKPLTPRQQLDVWKACQDELQGLEKKFPDRALVCLNLVNANSMVITELVKDSPEEAIRILDETISLVHEPKWDPLSAPSYSISNCIEKITSHNELIVAKKRFDLLDKLIAVCKLYEGRLNTTGLEGYATALLSRGESQRGINADKAAADIIAANTLRKRILEKQSWNWYAKGNLAKGYRVLCELYNDQGRHKEALEAFREFHKIWLAPYHSVPASMVDEPTTEPLRAMVPRLLTEYKALGMKRFTVPADFSGLKYPFHIYVTNVPYPTDPLAEQAQWLLELRGGVIPEEVREAFRKLHKIAHEHKVSFIDLCVYALGTTLEERAAEESRTNQPSTKPLLMDLSSSPVKDGNRGQRPIEGAVNSSIRTKPKSNGPQPTSNDPNEKLDAIFNTQ